MSLSQYLRKKRRRKIVRMRARKNQIINQSNSNPPRKERSHRAQ